MLHVCADLIVVVGVRAATLGGRLALARRAAAAAACGGAAGPGGVGAGGPAGQRQGQTHAAAQVGETRWSAK